MTSTLQKLGVHFMAGWLALAVPMSGSLAKTLQPAKADGAAAGDQTAGAAFSWEGRWQQVKRQRGEGHALAIGTLEIARCAEGFCGRLVEHGACGPVMMTLAMTDAEHLEGALKLGDRTFDAELASEGGKAHRVALSASEGSSFVSRESMTLSVDLVAKGPAHCPPLPTS